MQIQFKERASFQPRQVPELGSLSQPPSSGFKSAGVKGLRNLPWCLKTAKPCGMRVPAWGPTSPWCEAVKGSLISLETRRYWRCQTRGTAKESCTHRVKPAREREGLQPTKLEGELEPRSFQALGHQTWMELQDLEVALLGFHLALVQHSLLCPLPPFGNGNIYSVSQCVGSMGLAFGFAFTGGYNKSPP